MSSYTKRSTKGTKAKGGERLAQTRVLNRLWVDTDGEHCYCDEHRPAALDKVVKASPRKRYHKVGRKNWEYLNLSMFDLSSNEDADSIENMGCDECGSRLILGVVDPDWNEVGWPASWY